MSYKKNLCLVQETTGGRKGRKVGGNKMEVECVTVDDTDETFKNAKKAAAPPAEEGSTNGSASQGAAQGGAKVGGADIKSKYKKALNKKTLEDLRKMAKGKGIKITTKKDGKSVYLKKSSIINKLCNFKHPKKPVKKTTKRK